VPYVRAPFHDGARGRNRIARLGIVATSGQVSARHASSPSNRGYRAKTARQRLSMEPTGIEPVTLAWIAPSIPLSVRNRTLGESRTMVHV
jgi:hypothetical protein